MMRRLVLLVEERSMKEVLEVLLPEVLPPDYPFIVVPHEGKSDLERSVPRKLKRWAKQADFVVMRDQDGADCHALKATLQEICAEAGRPDTLVRIVCNELESWFLGDLEAVEAAFGVSGVARRQGERKYRAPDRLTNAGQEVRRLVPGYREIAGARAIAPHLTPDRNRSRSFRNFVAGVRRVTAAQAESER
jgi:hypothetical protein